MRASGIYKITNIITNEFYIGSGTYIKSRWARHRCDLNKGRHANKHLQSSWNKHGPNSFVFEVIEQCDKHMLKDKEQYYIDTMRPRFNKLMVVNSSIGFNHSEETKNKLREIFKGKPPSNKGKKMSEETKELLRKAWEKRKLTPVSQETRAKISKALKGVKKTENHIKKVVESNKKTFLNKQKIKA